MLNFFFVHFERESGAIYLSPPRLLDGSFTCLYMCLCWVRACGADHFSHRLLATLPPLAGVAKESTSLYYLDAVGCVVERKLKVGCGTYEPRPVRIRWWCRAKAARRAAPSLYEFGLASFAPAKDCWEVGRASSHAVSVWSASISAFSFLNSGRYFIWQTARAHSALLHFSHTSFKWRQKKLAPRIVVALHI